MGFAVFSGKVSEEVTFTVSAGGEGDDKVGSASAPFGFFGFTIVETVDSNGANC